MSRHEPDLVAVRDLPPGRPEPTAESVARTWHAISRHQAAVHPVRRTRWLAPVAAAATVVALAVGGAVVLAPGRPTPVPAAPNPQEVMAQLIERAGQVPAEPVPPGMLLYRRSEGPEGWKEVRETWFDGQTTLPLRLRVDGVDRPVDDPYPAGSTAEENRRVVAAGGSWYFPTPGWLAGLPTDPAALRARLDEEIDAYAGPGPVEPEAHLTNHLLTTFAAAEPRLSPQVRVALYEVIADLDGLVAREVVVDGHRYQAVGQREPAGKVLTALLFDPASGRAVGEYHEYAERGAPAPPTPARFPPGTAGASSYLLWTFAVVPGTDQPG
ncbi:hypothetical protein [Micromonospora sp. NBRC 101691]|uniref:hypothetical protein n=1 Tax=Micromonospora sp. NBRC 101691 TaxID=3032198 RepID=UPI002553BF40|nr:hypothetical protein [Micromonospora sp. NBRC 101691]